MIESIGFDVVPYPPYSQDLAPSDLWLFAAFKKHIKGIHVECAEKWFREEPGGFYTDEFEKLVQRRRRYIELEEHYVKK
jgi:hypothetical protein